MLLTFEFIAVFSESDTSLWASPYDLFRFRVEVTVAAEVLKGNSKEHLNFHPPNHLPLQSFPSVQFAVSVVEDRYEEFA